jgi:hypothetical protein
MELLGIPNDRARLGDVVWPGAALGFAMGELSQADQASFTLNSTNSDPEPSLVAGPIQLLRAGAD